MVNSKKKWKPTSRSTPRVNNLYIGLILALALLGFALDRLGYMGFVRTFVQTLAAPLQSEMTTTAQEISGYLESSVDVRALQARNAELEELTNNLMVENVQLKELERENETLRQLLNYTRNNPQLTYETTTVRGRSVGVDPTNLLSAGASPRVISMGRSAIKEIGA